MKVFRKVMSMVFPVFGLMFCFILFKSVYYNLTRLSLSNGEIDFIGRANLPTFKLFFTPTFFMILEILFIIVFSVFNILFAFKHKQNNKINWFLLGLMLAIIGFYIFITPQAYVISLYATFQFFSGFNTLFLARPFMYIRLAVTILTLTSLLPFKTIYSNFKRGTKKMNTYFNPFVILHLLFFIGTPIVLTLVNIIFIIKKPDNHIKF